MNTILLFLVVGVALMLVGWFGLGVFCVLLAPLVWLLGACLNIEEATDGVE